VKAVRGSYRSAPALLPLFLFSLGHLCVDVYSGVLGALQPLLVKRFGLSLAQAGLLGGALVFSASLMQPAYGYLSDRINSRLFAALGPAVAGVFISLLGLAPGYPWLFAMVLLGGAGVAAFHPQASSQCVANIESNRGRAMAVFVSSGTLGFALGPLFFSLLAREFGLAGVWTGAIPGVLVSVLLLTLLPAPARQSSRGPAFDWQPLLKFWKPITLLFALVFLRSAVQVVYGQFIPLYLTIERGFSNTVASLGLSIYITAGAIGGLAGGHLADRFGGKLVIALSMIGSVPFLLAFFLTRGAASLIALAAGGLVLLFTIPVNVVMAQDLAPAQAGTVSALMMGFAYGTSGLIFIPLTGWMSDLFSIRYALMALLAFPLAGFGLSLLLPAHAHR